MDDSNHTGNIGKDSLELIINEFAEDQKLYHKTIGDLVTAINGLTDRVKQLEEKVGKPQAVTVSTDTRPIQETIKKGMTDIRLIMSGRPSNITRKFQILLFPEQEAKLFYKVVFGRWFLWLTIMLFLTNLYKFSVRWNDNQKEIQIQREESKRISKAWNYLYLQSDKAVKRLMDSAYLKGVSNTQ